MAVESVSKPAPQTSVNSDDSDVGISAAIARGIALFMGLFTLLNLVIAIRHPGYDANLWWIDLYPLPQKAPLLAETALLFMALGWLAFAFAPRVSDWRRRATQTPIELLALFIVWNTISYYGLMIKGRISSNLPIPFSLFVLLMLWIVWRGLRADRPRRGPAVWGIMALTIGVLAIGVPLMQIALFGAIDYRGLLDKSHPADVVVVFGGAEPIVLADRVKAAAELHNAKLVVKVVLSGTPGEIETMREVALREKVDEEAVIVDTQGGSGEAGIRSSNARINALLPDLGERKGLVVAMSHFYELPRIKMNFWRDEREVLTLPVHTPMQGPAGRVFNEVGLLWKYYFDAAMRQ